MTPQSLERKLAAILAADVVGYSRLMGEDEAGTLSAIRRHFNGLIEPKVKQYNGRIVKLMGDGALMEFPSVVEASCFAVEVQCAMVERNRDVPADRQITYRIGINIGDIIVEGDDIYGDGVNIAARLEALAEPGGVCIARNVYDHIRNKLELRFEHLGKKEVKNIAEPVSVYRILLDSRALALVTPVDMSKPWSRSRSRSRQAIAAASAVLLLVTASIVYRQDGLYGLFRPPVLTLWTNLNQREFSVLANKVLPLFEDWQRSRGRDSIAVNVENVTAEAALARLKRGAVADLITFDVNGYRRDLVEPDELIRDLSEMKGLLPSAVHPTMAKNLEINEKRYFIPFRGNIRLVFLNKLKLDETRKRCRDDNGDLKKSLSNDHLMKCQFLPSRPRTWREIKDIAEIFKAIGGEERVVIAATKSDKSLFLFELIRLAVGDPCDLPTRRLEAVGEVIRFIKIELWPHVGVKSRDVDWRTAGGFLLSDSVYLARDWTYSLSSLRESGRIQEFDIYEGLIWRGAKPVYLLGGDFLAIPKSGRHTELAKELLRFLISREVQAAFVKELSWPAMRVDVVSEAGGFNKAHNERVNQAMLKAAPVPDYWDGNTRQFYENLFEMIVDPNRDVEDAIAQFRERWPVICGRRDQ